MSPAALNSNFKSLESGTVVDRALICIKPREILKYPVHDVQAGVVFFDICFSAAVSPT